jgi:hypothetical protein
MLTYEQCVALKDAGFPQEITEASFGYYSNGDSFELYFDQDDFVEDVCMSDEKRICACPTLEDMLSWLRGHGVRLSLDFGLHRGSLGACTDDGKIDIWNVEFGDDPSPAVGALILKILKGEHP